MKPEVIGIIGGAGAAGSGLAARWAAAGHPVFIGSRDPARASSLAQELRRRLPAGSRIEGCTNQEAASRSAIVVLAVPYAAHLQTALGLSTALDGKILIDVTVPLRPPKVSIVQLPEAGSSAVALQQALGAGVRVVSAFQNVSAHRLQDFEAAPDCDVLVCSDDPAARETTCRLAQAAGLRGIEAGPLANAVAAESLTAVLIWINRKNRVQDAGVRVTGLAQPQ